MKFTVYGSHKDGLIEIRFKDYSQKGMVDFTKTGQTPIGVEVKESDFCSCHKCIRFILRSQEKRQNN